MQFKLFDIGGMLLCIFTINISDTTNYALWLKVYLFT